MGYTIIPGSITAAPGFKAGAVNAGVKSSNTTKKDIAVILSETPATVGGVFTQNKVKAAPVLLSEKVVVGGTAQAIVVNSGNANACTGEQGEKAAQLMAQWTGEELGLDPAQIIVSSTGVIGHQLPMDVIKSGITNAVAALSSDGGPDAAEAIMTTDLVVKELAVKAQVGDYTITLGGIAKGSGMIHPNMATMLGFVTTDLAIEAAALKKAVKTTADRSFNMITVDQDTSTNDMLVVMANGAAGNVPIKEGDAELEQFQQALDYVCIELAKLIARDGEGATKFLEVQVLNAQTEQDARIAAKSVMSSSLVKSAFFGEDANWGRIIAAVGYSGADFDPYQVDIWIKSAAGEEKMADKGTGLEFDEAKAKKILQEKDIVVVIDLNGGTVSATAWGCDLTYDYVKINADYRT